MGRSTAPDPCVPALGYETSLAVDGAIGVAIVVARPERSGISGNSTTRRPCRARLPSRSRGRSFFRDEFAGAGDGGFEIGRDIFRTDALEETRFFHQEIWLRVRTAQDEVFFVVPEFRV